MILQATVTKSPVTGESTKETVKTIAQGRPVESGEPVVTILVCFFQFAREAAGAPSARLSLRPLLWRAVIYRTSGAFSAARRSRCVSRRSCDRTQGPITTRLGCLSMTPATKP